LIAENARSEVKIYFTNAVATRQALVIEPQNTTVRSSLTRSLETAGHQAEAGRERDRLTSGEVTQSDSGAPLPNVRRKCPVTVATRTGAALVAFVGALLRMLIAGTFAY
jgi:hypothetical protein